MSSVRARIDDFLAQPRLAVAGVSRDGDQPANAIYRRLRDTGHEVYPTNPVASEVEGDTCYPDLRHIPVEVDGVMVVTPPDQTDRVVEECIALDVPRVWMHRSLGAGSVSEAAVGKCREHGIDVIVGGCPMMFCGDVDFGHKCLRWFARVTGKMES